MKAQFLALCLTGIGFNAFAAEWEAVTAALLKAEKPGYGGVSGVVVDRHSGEVYVWLSDRGLYRSADQGTSWQAFGPRVKGRTEWPGCMLTNPNGPIKQWLIATVYGGPIRFSDDSGASWNSMDAKSTHVDWAMVDWQDPRRRFVLTLKHESGDLLLASEDAGKSFREVGKGFGPACIFDSKTAVVAQIETKQGKKPGSRTLALTTDGARTFEPVADYHARALPTWFGETPYWLVDGALITSSDRGRTWKRLGKISGGISGPSFGKNAQELFVLTSAGVVESVDGGSTWSQPLALPQEMKAASPLSWIAYDPASATLYVMKMGSELYRMKRNQKAN